MEYFTEEKEKELKMDILKQFYISKSKKEINIKQTITSLLDNPQIETFTIKRKENIFLISKIFQHLFDLLILNIQQFSFISLSKTNFLTVYIITEIFSSTLINISQISQFFKIILFYLYYEKKEEFELLSTTKISILHIFNNLIHKQKYLFPFLLFQEFMKII
ncbi:hypothetical protein M0811_14161 [Anaeramoeba ignava]|uniref:Uncharacterized protein n=1 Tax=Anaeramoeba ignava TaxID=1746090 RepID=A0A9Q0LWZ7_ANAIG|nr:hypothetical protein M0811_14161 [Anaeramoeba ignava]